MKWNGYRVSDKDKVCFNKKNITKIIRFISKYDFFYKKKFQKFQFRKSYIVSFFRNFNFNCKLFLGIFFF